MSAALLRRWLAHPLTAGMSLDEAGTTTLRKQIISSKPFLRAIYEEWYSMLVKELPPDAGTVLELGSGAGFCERFIPGLITSEVFPSPGVQIVLDAQALPFPDESLGAIVLTDVMHHVPDVRAFLAEASRCLRTGGKIIMIEPWLTRWSRFIYTHFHHEPFLPEAREWRFPSTGPLSGANGAIPWIVFVRDRRKFEGQFPRLAIEKIRPFMPFRYLVSGGVGLRSLMPGFTHALWARLEAMLEPWMPSLAMFALIAIRKK